MPDGFVIVIIVFLVIVVYYVSLIILTRTSSSSQEKEDKQFFDFFGISPDSNNIAEVRGKIQDKVLQLLDQNDLVELDRAIEIATAANYSSSIAVTFFKLKTQIKILEDKNRAHK